MATDRAQVSRGIFEFLGCLDGMYKAVFCHVCLGSKHLYAMCKTINRGKSRVDRTIEIRARTRGQSANRSHLNMCMAGRRSHTEVKSGTRIRDKTGGGVLFLSADVWPPYQFLLGRLSDNDRFSSHGSKSNTRCVDPPLVPHCGPLTPYGQSSVPACRPLQSLVLSSSGI